MAEQKKKSKKEKITSPKGMRDILPENQNYWKYVIKKGIKIAEDYGFEQIDTPILEQTGLFVRSVGEGTDIIDKELYSLETEGGDKLSLRPEGTASVARSYVENGMSVWPNPVRLFYVGPMFRHDQPQHGRARQFHQMGVELFGVDGPIGDAQVILMAYKYLQSMGIKDLMVKINTIGNLESRNEYIKKLKEFVKPKLRKLCESCKDKYKTNILRTLDCKEEACKEIFQDAPEILDFLDKEAKDHFKLVLEFLDEVEVPYVLDSTLVRGLDYYTRTVFEIMPDSGEEVEEKKAETSESDKPEGDKPESDKKEVPEKKKKKEPLTLIAGGRYNRLVEQLGGPKTPACGWAAGLERIIMYLKEKGANIPGPMAEPKVFVAQLGDAGKRKGLKLFEMLRHANIRVASSLGKDSIKSQLRVADKLNVQYALIVGQKEALDDTVIIRDMETGIQEVLPMSKIIDIFHKRLK